MNTQSNKLSFVTFVFIGAFSLLTCAPCSAQGVGSSRGLPGGSDGQHTIKGKVFTPEGKPFEKGLRVKLESNVIPSVNATTDPDGSFIFNSLVAGNYTLIIDAGPEYEPVRESLTIYGTSGFGNALIGQTIMVPPIILRAKGAAATGVAGVIPADVPKEAADLFYKARESAAKKDHKKAIEQLNAAIKLHPNFGLALNELGAEYLATKQYEEAIEPLQSAVKLLPKEFGPHFNYGVALYNDKKLDDAESELRAALKINNASQMAHYYLGLVLLGQHKRDDAEVEFLATIKNGGENMAQVHKYLGGIYWSKNDPKRAADELEKYLKLDPNAPDAERIKGTVKDLRSKL